MNRFLSFFKLGVKYLYRYKKRYYFLLAALVFGFGTIGFVTSTKDGMYNNVYFAAQSHYAGDIVAVADYSPRRGTLIHRMGINEINAIMEAAELAGINPQYTVIRTITWRDAVLHFNGFTASLRNLIGSDWESEAHLFANKNFYEAPVSDIGDDGIILSLAVAESLGIRMGDMLILELNTMYGQRNTGQFIVRGIVDDTSLFGYFKAYISRLSHNRLLLFEDDDASSVGFFLYNTDTAEKDRLHLHEYMVPLLQTGHLFYDREGMENRSRNNPWEGVRVFLYTMPVYLSEIAFFLDALNIISYIVYIMMLIAVFVSSLVTYRLILHERTREMGVMRTIGFFGQDLSLVLWSEIMVLGLVSMLFGFILTLFFNFCASFISFSWLPGFDIFLRNGKLSPLYLRETVLTNIILLFIVLFLLVLAPSIRVSLKKLPALLSGEPI